MTQYHLNSGKTARVPDWRGTNPDKKPGKMALRRPMRRPWRVEELEARSLLATFTVTSTANAGAGSLRQAILDANAATGNSTINFSIGSGVQTIKPTSALPAITNHVLIDATTQPGFLTNGTPEIVLDGSLAGSGAAGLLITGGGSTVRGLVIYGFSGSGIQLDTNGGNVIQGNDLGTDVTGTVAEGNGTADVFINNGLAGVLINNSPNNLIGGTTVATRNLISGNRISASVDGVDVVGAGSTGNLIEGNYIGTDVTGTKALMDHNGVYFDLGASNNTVGGTAPGAGNLIAGNYDDGVQFTSSTTSGNVVEGNLIGTDVSGTVALGNDSGVLFINAPNNVVGGTTAAAANVIAGNGTDGILIAGSSATGNLIQGNFIGTDRTGTLSLGNSPNGVVFANAADGWTGIGYPTNDTLGGTVAGAGNTIAHNAGVGIAVLGGSGDTFEGNAIYGNAGLGIDLGNDGVTANASALKPTKPNSGMDYPVFTSVTEDSNTLTVAGYVGTAAGQSAFAGARVEVFESDNDPSGHGEGLVDLGALTTDAGGNFSGTLTTGGLSPSDRITGTATIAADGTSEFAANVSSRFASIASVVASANPSVYGQGVTFTASVSSSVSGAGTPTGSVTFLDAATSLGTVALSGGTAVLTTSALSAGNHDITVSYGGDSLFLTSTSASLTQAVTPAPLTVTAGSASKVYGQANPTFTYSYSGFVNGETSAVLGGSPSLGTTATASSGVGGYAIMPAQGSLGDANYSFVFQPGTLTVTAAPLTITANDAVRTYGQPNPAFSASYNGFVNGDTAAAVGGLTFTTSATAGSGVGLYSIAPGGASAGNYAITYVDGQLTIDPAALSVAAIDLGKIYGAALPALTYTYAGLASGDTASVFSGTLATAATSGSDIGAYPITQGTLSAGPNYTIGFTDGTLNVNPAPLTITANDKAKVYGAALPAFDAAIAGLVNGDTIAVVSGLSLSSTATAASPVGPYPITPTGASAANYTISYVNGSLDVTPAAVTVAADPQSKVYGAAVPALTYTFTGLVNGDTAADFSGALATATTPGSDVGTYAINQGTLSAGPNYTVSYTGATLTVNPATLTVAANDAAKTYGAAVPTLTYTDSGLVNGDTASVLTGALATAATAASGAGDYTIGQGTLSAGPDYTIGFAGGTLTVNPAPLTITANDKVEVYGAAPPAFDASYSGLVNGDTASVVSGLSFSTTATAGSSVGTYPITPGGASDGNYTITYAAGHLTVAPAVVAVTADDQAKTYGAALPALTYTFSGLVDGDTAAVFSGALATTATSGSDVGTYAITRGTLSAGPNYAVSYTGATLTVNPASLTVAANAETMTYGGAVPSLTYTDSGLVNGDSASLFSGALATSASAASGTGSYAIDQGTLSAGLNYAIHYTGATLTVTPATLTVTAVDQGKTYGAALPTLAYTDSGLVNGDTATVLSGALATTANAGSDVGAYAITQGTVSAGPNYTITFSNGTLTVNPAPLTIAANDKAKVYGDALPALDAAITGLVNGDTAAVVSGLNLSTTATTASPVGSYPITPTGASAADYTIAYVNGSLAVTPATITVTADPRSKTYGAAVPALSYTFSGLVNGDTAAVFSGAPATAATAGSDVGTYAISQGTLSAGPNYTADFAGATLTVSPAALTVTANDAAKTYGAVIPALTFTASGLVNGDTSGVFTGALATPATAASGVGGYAITQGTLSAGINYTIGFTGGTLTVTPATLLITANDQCKTFGAALPALDAAITGLVNGDTAAVVSGLNLATSASAASPVGAYAITPSGASASNYAIHYADGTLDVTPATLDVTADDQTTTYGAALPALTYTDSGLVNGDTIAVFSGALATTATSSSGVGGYAITRGTLSAGSNYSIDFTGGTLTVDPATLTVTAHATGKVYGAAVPTLTYSDSGLVNGDTAAVLSGSLATAASASSDVGTYAISQGTLSAGANYAIHYAGASLTVTPATLTVAAVHQGKTYGAALPALTYTDSGLVNGDTANVFSGAPSSGATAGSNVGTYAITQGTLSAGSNYSIAFTGGTLTVNPATLTITANDKAKVYGNALPALDASITGLVNGDTNGVVSGLIFSTTATAASPVGSYAITPQGASAANYTISYRSGTLGVTPASVTVTADDRGKVYGAAVPTLTYTFSGLVNGDTGAVFSGSLGTPATSGSNTGAYPIDQGTLSAGPNYSIAYTDGTLTVTPAPLTVTANDQSRVYGASNPSFTASYDGFVNGDTASSLGGELDFNTTASAASPVGQYTVAASGLTSGNYTISFVDGMLAVTPAPLVISANDAIRNFGQPNPAFSATFIGLVNGDTPRSLGATSFNTAATDSSPAGRYAVTPSGLRSPNYAITYQPGTLTVTPTSVTASLAPIAATEGVPFQGTVATFTDNDPTSNSGNYSATIAWGDGNVTAGVIGLDSARNQFTVAGTNTFEAAGNYATEVVIRFLGAVVATADGQSVIADAPLLVRVGNVAATEGTPFTGVVGTFTDAGPPDQAADYAATITWGDGQTSLGVVSRDGRGDSFTILGSNTYASEGVYAVRVVVQSASGAQGTATGLGVVAAAPMSVEGVPVASTAGTLFSGAVAAINDADPSSRAADYSATIDWGDGGTSPATVVADGPGHFLVLGSHTFDEGGGYRGVVEVLGRDGRRTSVEIVATLDVPATTNPTPVSPTAVVPPRSIVMGPVQGNPVATVEVTTIPTTIPPDPVTFGPTIETSAVIPQGAVAPAANPHSSSSAVEPANPPGRGVMHEGDAAIGEQTRAVMQTAIEGAVAFVSHRLMTVLEDSSPAHPSTDPHSPSPPSVHQEPRGVVKAAIISLTEDLRQALDELGQDVDPERKLQLVQGVVGGIALAYAGYVFLQSRAAYVLLSVLTAHPIWTRMDPLSILLDWEKEKARRDRDDDREETLQSLVDEDADREEETSREEAAPRTQRHGFPRPHHPHFGRRALPRSIRTRLR